MSAYSTREKGRVNEKNRPQAGMDIYFGLG